jgi:hypothetical protein
LKSQIWEWGKGSSFKYWVGNNLAILLISNIFQVLLLSQKFWMKEVLGWAFCFELIGDFIEDGANFHFS